MRLIAEVYMGQSIILLSYQLFQPFHDPFYQAHKIFSHMQFMLIFPPDQHAGQRLLLPVCSLSCEYTTKTRPCPAENQKNTAPHRQINSYLCHLPEWSYHMHQCPIDCPAENICRIVQPVGTPSKNSNQNQYDSFKWYAENLSFIFFRP